MFADRPRDDGQGYGTAGRMTWPLQLLTSFRGVLNAQADLSELSYFLAAATAPSSWVKAFVDLRSGSPVITYGEVFVGPEPSSWQGPALWEYPECCFVARPVTTDTLAKWASEAQAEPGAWPGFDPLKLPLRQGVFSRYREPSRPQHDRHHYPYPTLRYRVPLEVEQQYQHVPGGFLVSSDAPSFIAAAGAFNAFFYNDYRVTGANAPSLGSIDWRFADLRGAFRRTKVSPTQLSLEIEGKSNDLRVELNSVSLRDEQLVPLHGELEMPLPGGPPDDAWVWLKQGSDWVDYRSLGGWPAHQAGDVEYELPDDPEANLTSLIAQGEGPELEFKAQLPDKNPESKRQTYKTVAAFAMGHGGVIIFGVQDRTGRLLGLQDEEEVLKQRFTSMLRRFVRPTPRFEARCQTLEDKILLIIEIEPSDGVIHAVTIEADKPEYYVRRGATTFYAEPEELQSVSRAAASAWTPLGDVFGSS